MIPYSGLTCEELSVTNEKLTSLPNLRFYDAKEVPGMRIYGILETEDKTRFCRIPENVASNTNQGVMRNNYHPAGGRVRFVTTSEYVAVRRNIPYKLPSSNLNMLATTGFDFYVKRDGKETFVGSVKPSIVRYGDGFDGIIQLPKGKKELTVNLPLYSDSSTIYIGLDSESELYAHPDYKLELPVVFCGSSITQGGCASRPGLAYEAIISRRYDINFTNLGFAGSFLAEDAMIEYISTLNCSALVMDYDHNAPNHEHLEKTHEKLYLRFRESHPDTPVVMIGRPDFSILGTADAKRRQVIFNTYNNARLRGEKVVFVDGYSLFGGELHEECTVDGIHPNDLGMYRMADVIGKALSFALSM